MRTRDEIKAEREAIHEAYRSALRRSAALVLEELLVVATEKCPQAVWLGLSISDQDMSGMVDVAEVFDAEGNDLEKAELFDDCSTWDLDDRNASAWQIPGVVVVLGPDDTWETHGVGGESDYYLNLPALRTYLEAL